MNDVYDLQRFVDAQERVYDSVLEELRRGQKTNHWMWFIFPQIKGLGASATAQAYAISSLEEARAYWEHPILGPRLRECTRLVLGLEGRSVEQIFHHPDNLKFRSCMTLFDRCVTDNTMFRDTLQKYFGGEPDRLTLSILDKE
jgi:uncharacterized protein (DUF1810 family)